MLSPLAKTILKHPGRFLLRVLKGFRANQGLLLSGAVAYYALLSIIPLFILLMVALSHVVDETRLLATVARYLELAVPAESQAIVNQLAEFLSHRGVLSWVMVGILLFFSSMTFTVLENAMSVIFFHRVAIQRRHFLISALLPYLFILLLGLGFLVVTLISSLFQSVEATHITFLGHDWGFDGLSSAVLYLIGLGGEVLMLTSIYLVMPVGRLSLRHALLGGVTAALLWEVTRLGLTWYFSTLRLLLAITANCVNSCNCIAALFREAGVTWKCRRSMSRMLYLTTGKWCVINVRGTCVINWSKLVSNRNRHRSYTPTK